ncbi:MAG: 50S ribosomal protein L5 [Candidatus Aenigmatarchaeota archaeon]
MNVMKRIELEKVVLNVGCGGDLEKIEKAKKLLEILTGGKPVVTKSKRRSTFGIAKGKPVGVMITLRGEKADDFLRRALHAVDGKLKISQFDEEGNFSFGVKEYIDIQGTKYSHEIGMLGLDVCVSLKRPGYRIKYRRIQKRKIPKKHKISKEEAVEWVKKNYGVEIVE